MCPAATDFEVERSSDLDPFSRGQNTGLSPVRVTLTFEGGGAKGIGHFGAWRAISEGNQAGDADPVYGTMPRYKVEAVSGTSSGSLVAALYAAGYDIDDVLPTRGRSQALKDAGLRRLVDIFGRWWTSVRFRFVRFLLSWPLTTAIAGALLWISLGFIAGKILVVPKYISGLVNSWNWIVEQPGSTLLIDCNYSPRVG
jgi:hypothetical protein